MTSYGPFGVKANDLASVEPSGRRGREWRLEKEHYAPSQECQNRFMIQTVPAAISKIRRRHESTG
jgi:hypothetical protein